MDSYRTIRTLAEGTYSEKRSKFLAFAMPVRSVEEVKQLVGEYQKKYPLLKRLPPLRLSRRRWTKR